LGPLFFKNLRHTGRAEPAVFAKWTIIFKTLQILFRAHATVEAYKWGFLGRIPISLKKKQTFLSLEEFRHLEGDYVDDFIYIYAFETIR